MRVYRLAKKKYRSDLSGLGAETNDGRWNNIGMRMTYTSSSRALACVEVAVHLKLNKGPKNYFIMSLEIPEGVIKNLDQDLLKGIKWDVYPPVEFTQHIGDNFIIENEYAVLRVASAVVKGEYNVLLNPMHKDFRSIGINDIELFRWDKRLFGSETDY